MATLVTDPRLEERLKQQRRAWGADHHDEVWEGIYIMAPLPSNEHQEIISRLVFILEYVLGLPGLGKVFPGANLAGFGEDWEKDYRCPDVVVVLRGGAAQDCDTHWRGGADFVIEITSPGDRTHEKIPFYAAIGVRELLVVDRQPWTLELYRWQDGQLPKVGQSTAADGQWLPSAVVPLRFRLTAAEVRPRIEVAQEGTDRLWII